MHPSLVQRFDRSEEAVVTPMKRLELNEICQAVA